MGATLDELVEHFTGRDDELAAYEQLWMPGARSRVLAFSGFSGNGKSSLLLYLAERERERRRPVAVLDLSDPALSQPHRFLDRLAAELAATIPGLDRELRGYRTAADNAQRAAAAIVAGSGAAQANVEITARERSTISGARVEIDLGGGDVQAETNRRLTEHWRDRRGPLLRDLTAAIRRHAWVLLVDTYEVVAHTTDSEFRDWFAGELLGTIARDCPNARVVVAGREKLPRGPWREMALAEWDRERTSTYLRGWGMVDDELLDAVFEHCQGHPLATDLARLAWEAGERSGTPLRPEDLRTFTSTSPDLAVEWLMVQFVRRVPEELREAVLASAHFRHLTHEALETVLPDGRRITDAVYNELLRLSFVRPAADAPDGAHRAHDLVRQVEQARRQRERPAERIRLNEAALTYFTERGDMLNLLYHGFVADEAGSLASWVEAIDKARVAYDRSSQGALLNLLAMPERWTALGAEWQGFHALFRGLLAWQEDRLQEAEEALRSANNDFAKAGGNHVSLGRALSVQLLGDLYVRMARLKEADAAYGMALPIYRSVQDRLGEADTNRALGELYTRTDRLEEAEAAYRLALPTYQAVEDRIGEASTQKALGDLHVRTARLGEAEVAYGLALEIYRSVGARIGEANAHWVLGDLYVRTDRLREAEVAYGLALPIYQVVQERLGEANIHRALGDLYVRTDRLREAEATYGLALPIYQAVQERLGEANTLKALGGLYVRTDRLREAEAAYRLALPIYQAVQSRIGEANTYWAIGELYVRTGRLGDAEAACVLALPIYHEVQDRLGEANTHLALGDLYMRTGRLGEAKAAYGLALSIQQAIQDRLGEVTTLQALGDLYVRTGALGEAETTYGLALPIHEAIQDTIGEANTHKALGDLYMRTGRLVEAEAAYGLALPIYKAVQDRLGEANTVRALGDLYVRTGRRGEAETAYGVALPIYQAIGDRIGEANVYQSRARLHVARGDIESAEAAFDTALHMYMGLEDGYSYITALAYRGLHRLDSGPAAGGSDWGAAIALSLVVEPHLAGEVVVNTMGQVRARCWSGDQDEPLTIALAALVRTAEQQAAELSLSDGARDLLRVVLAGFGVIAGICGRSANADELRRQAAEVDDQTAGAWGLADLVSKRLGDQ